MAKFEVEIHGIPFTVDGVETEDQAQARVLEASQNDPDLFRSKARGLGLQFDEESQTARERSEVSKFLIGTGKSVSDTIDMVHTAFLEQTGADFAELQVLEARIASDQETFDKLADAPGSVSADAGEIVGTGVQLLGTGGLGLVRGVVGMAKFLSPFRWFKEAGNAMMNKLAANNVNGPVMQAALQTQKGQQTIRAMQAAKSPSDKALDAFAKNLKQAADDFTPTP